MHKSSVVGLAENFKEEYHIELPVLNIPELLRRDQSGSIVLEGDEYYVVRFDNFNRKYPNLINDNKEKSIREIYTAIADYAKLNYDVVATEEEIQTAMKALLYKNSIEVLKNLRTVMNSIEYHESELHRIIAEYITNCTANELSTISEIFIGNILSHVIGLKEKKDIELFEGDQKVLSGCCVYLDTPILIPLLGASDKSYQQMYEVLIDMLQKAGAAIMTFTHVVAEVETILRSSYTRIRTSPFTRYKANPAALFFYDNQYLLPHLQLLITNLPGYIENNLNIEIVSCDYNSNNEHMIDCKQLEAVIREIYSDNGERDYFELLRYNTPINTDVKSISAIQCLRLSKVPKRIVDAEHILLTKNWGLLKASRNFTEQTMHEVDLSFIVVIDCYLSTLLWNVQIKHSIDDYYRNKLVSDCLSIISPSPKFMETFAERVTQYSTKNGLTDEETQLMMLHPDYVNSAYIQCGNDPTCVLDTLAEIEARKASKLTQPLENQIRDLDRENYNHRKDLSQIAGDLDLANRTVESLKTESSDKDEEIKRLNAENRRKEHENRILEFKESHYWGIRRRYFTQWIMITEGLFLILDIALVIFKSWFFVLLGVAYIIARKIFKLRKHYRLKSIDDIARMMYSRDNPSENNET